MNTIVSQGEKKWRFAYTRAMLTYKTHLDKGKLRKFFGDPPISAERVEIAHETSDQEHPYDHTHLYVDFGRQFNTRSPRYFDVEEIHPNIKPVTTRKHIENVLGYLAKQDPENAHLLEEKQRMIDDETHSEVERIWAKPNLTEALRTAKLRDAIPIINVYAHRPVETPEEPDPEWYPWQMRLFYAIAKEADDRHILWVIDTKGGKGKSRVAKYLAVTARALVILFTGRATDIMETAINAMDAGLWEGRIVVFDLARDAEQKNIYEPIELFKNGILQSHKYRGRTRVIKSPHVVVFANFSPNYAKLTRDRWVIWNLDEEPS